MNNPRNVTVATPESTRNIPVVIASAFRMGRRLDRHTAQRATTPPINKFHVTVMSHDYLASIGLKQHWKENLMTLVGRTRRINILKLAAVFVLANGIGINGWKHNFSCKYFDGSWSDCAVQLSSDEEITITFSNHSRHCQYLQPAGRSPIVMRNSTSSQRLSEGGSDVPSKIEPKRKPSNSQTLTAQTERVKKSHCSGEQSGQLLSRCKHKHVYCCTYMLSPIHDCHRAASEKGPTGNF
ncbi:Hypothetical protein SMAX5B_008764 [Scophthalmus maximus]|uniref:Uncharacterized protein n=1 Tax=Scophthalmus maximus TaxID=52904 RepID=A0A2U9CCW4_SCOMX|nr:Hypothetical protein SMAX5B_008764 [Scophthalmus maximus]